MWLSIRRKKRKHCVRARFPLREHTAADQEWALDFVHDAIAAGRSIRVLSVLDAYTRACLALEVDTSFASLRVTRTLDEIIEQRGQPRSIHCNNGPELTSRHFLAWAIERKIELVHIQPGKPTQNARGKLSWTPERGVSASKLVLQPVRRQKKDRSLAPRVQRTTTAWQFEVPDTGRVHRYGCCGLNKITVRNLGAGQSRSQDEHWYYLQEAELARHKSRRSVRCSHPPIPTHTKMAVQLYAL